MLGFMDFTLNQILTSAQMDGVLRQTVMNFASTAARDSALSGILEEGMLAYTTDAPNTLWYYSGVEWKRILSEAEDYTPSWTNLTVGNGTTVAKKQYVGGMLVLRGQLTFGTTTAITGAVSQTIPGAIAGDTAGSCGSGVANDAGTAIYGIITSVSPSDSVVIFAHSAQINTTVPFTWTTGDVLKWHIAIGV